MARIYKFQIQLSETEMRWLICWAKIHGKPKATYAAQIIGARTEGNIRDIREMMKDIARYEGISTDELESRWLEEENFQADEESDRL
jgi:hypothetical protein